MSKYYVAHDREYQEIWRWNVPEVYWLDQKQAKAVKLTKPWQRFIFELNQPGMTKKSWRTFAGINTAFTNTSGYGGNEPRADFINGWDMDAKPPVLDKVRICGGAIFHGTQSGEIITVETLNGEAKPPTVAWLVAHPWLMFRCWTVLPDGSNSDFPYGKGQPVFMPLVASGGKVTVKINTRLIGKPYPYVRKI